ncbi:Major facilitator superfamily multidrug transporter [Drechslerella dactyloides]|uniref:Major facilitator superfamily multidrug transporter n=1 Tax=Drechslerella dactyloides TaxID=74499 RepID=A0AAD6IUI7_DREDA|nr:Major facilitator superfamily multidrug transporter [Drechslerella dactyloides]
MARHSFDASNAAVDEIGHPLFPKHSQIELSSFAARPPSTSQSAPARPPNPRNAKEPPVTWSSLPHKSQLLILAACRLSEPLSNTCLLPYLYYLIRSLDSDAGNGQRASNSTISRRAGLLVAAFALAQFATSMLWARLADRFGRKPVIVYPLLVSIIANLGFGFGKTIPGVMFWRLIAGIANGNIGVMRTMTAEIVQERKYQSRAFLLLPLVFNSGNIAGLALGGLLATPTKSLPWLFGGIAWMEQYPFALPTIVNAFTLSIALVLAVGGLRETLPAKIGPGHRDFGIELRNRFVRLLLRIRAHGYQALSTDEESSASPAPVRPGTYEPPVRSIKALPPPQVSLRTKVIAMTLCGFTLLPLHNAAFMQLFPIFLSTPFNTHNIEPEAHPGGIFFTGGLGYDSSTIGLYLSAFGCSGIFLQMFIYPTLQAKFGTLALFRLAFIIFPLSYTLTPYVLLLSGPLARGVAIAFVLFLQVMARTLAIPSSVILLTNAAPSPKILGTLHGIGNMLSSFARAVGPALGGWVSAKGMEMGMVGCVWWTYLTGIAIIGLFVSWKMEEGKSPHEREKEEVARIKEDD